MHRSMETIYLLCFAGGMACHLAKATKLKTLHCRSNNNSFDFLFHRRRVVTSGESNAAEDAGACADQCKATRSCNAWFWCDDEDGCHSEGDVAVSRHGCHLESQQPAFPVEPPMSWPISTFVAGWQGGKPLCSLLLFCVLVSGLNPCYRMLLGRNHCDRVSPESPETTAANRSNVLAYLHLCRWLVRRKASLLSLAHLPLIPSPLVPLTATHNWSDIQLVRHTAGLTHNWSNTQLYGWSNPISGNFPTS